MAKIKHATLIEDFQDTKLVIWSCKSKDRQHNGQNKKDKRTNNDLQKIIHKTKDWITRTPLKTEVNSDAPEG
jgi:hypothetical protein